MKSWSVPVRTFQQSDGRFTKMNSDLVSDCSVCVCVCVQKASRSRWSRSPVRTACSPTSIIPTVLANTQSPSPGGVSTSRRGELYTACVCVCERASNNYLSTLPHLIWMVGSAGKWGLQVWASCSLCHLSVEQIEIVLFFVLILVFGA